MRLTNSEIVAGINADERIRRKFDGTGREIFSDGSGGLLEQFPGQDPQPFTPSQEDVEANDWVLASGLGSDIADEVLSIAHMLRDLAGSIENALDHPGVDQAVNANLSGLASRLLKLRSFLPQSFVDGVTIDSGSVTLRWDGAQRTPEGE